MKHAIIIIALAIFVACSSKSDQETKTEADSTTTPKRNETIVQLTDAQVLNAGIRTGKAEQRTISTILKVNGFIDVPPQNIVSVSVPMGGYLKTTKLLPGMYVSKGQSIAVIEDPQYIQLQQDYLTAKARLSFSEGEYNRQKTLNQSKATSDKQFQQTEADYNSQGI